MERPSGSGPAGIRIQDSSLPVRELHLASALELASLAGLAGAGTTGDTIGITTESFITTTPTSPTAEFSSIVTTSIAPVDSMAQPDFTAAALASTALQPRMDSPHLTPGPGTIPEHSVALTMEEQPEAFPHAGSRASVEVPTEAEASTVVVVTAAAVTGNLAHTANATDDMEKEIMRTNNMKLDALETFIVKLACGFASTILLLSLWGLLLVVGFANSSFAQDAQPKTFASPGEASNALFEAAQKEDEQGLEAILGAGKEVTSSSDEVEDKLEREQFCKKYQEMHRLVQEPDGSTVLYIGAARCKKWCMVLRFQYRY